MSFLIERRLRLVGRRLASLREELTITAEQLGHLADLTDDSRIRAMVSETPLADEEHREAERTSTAMAKHRVDLVQSITRLEAEQDEPRRRVALKVLHTHEDAEGWSARWDRIVREARLLGKLNHPNVVTIYDVAAADAEGDELGFIAMELVDGADLGQWLDASPRSPST